MESNVSSPAVSQANLCGGLCWKSIIAGAITAAVTSLVLLTLASGLGLAMASPFTGDTESIASFTVKVGLLMVVMQWTSAAFGGYIAGRLGKEHVGVHPQETFFRDYAHGFLTWAVATLLTAILLTSTVASVISGGAQAATVISAGAVAGASSTAMVDEAVDEKGYYIDALFRGSNMASPQSADDTNGEVTRIFVANLNEDTFSGEDRQYLAQMVVTRTGVSTDEATARVDRAIAKMDELKREGVEAAEKARKASSAFSLFTTLALLAGAFIASVASTLGGAHRRHMRTI